MDDAVAGQKMNITSEIGLPLNTINLGHLRRIMALRLEEIFQLILRDVEQAGLLEYLRAGCSSAAARAHPGDHAPGGTDFGIAGHGRQDHHDQRRNPPLINRVRHRHRIGEVRFAQAPAAGPASFLREEHQTRFRQTAPALTPRCHEL